MQVLHIRMAYADDATGAAQQAWLVLRPGETFLGVPFEDLRTRVETRDFNMVRYSSETKRIKNLHRDASGKITGADVIVEKRG